MIIIVMLCLSYDSVQSSIVSQTKVRLLKSLEGLNYGVKAGSAKKAQVESLVQELIADRSNDNMTRRNRIAEAFSGNAKAGKFFGGDWELLYTSGPDVTGIGKIPGVVLEYVGQTVDVKAGLITNIVNIRGPIADIDQQVFVKAKPSKDSSGTKVDLEFSGTKIEIKRIFGQSSFPVWGNVTKNIKPFEITFDKEKFDAQLEKSNRPRPAFNVEYIDKDLRIQRTGEGYIFIIKKRTPTSNERGLADLALGPWLESKIGENGMRLLGAVSVLPYVFFIFNLVQK
jgi:hypothetical protein